MLFHKFIIWLYFLHWWWVIS